MNCWEESFQKTVESIYFGDFTAKLFFISFDRAIMQSFTYLGPFFFHFLEIRHDEKVDLRKAGLAQSLTIAFGPIVPAVAATVTFLAVILSGNDVLASDVSWKITSDMLLLLITFPECFKCVVVAFHVLSFLQCHFAA